MQGGNVVGNQQIEPLQPGRQFLLDLVTQGVKGRRVLPVVQRGLDSQHLRVAGIQTRQDVYRDICIKGFPAPGQDGHRMARFRHQAGVMGQHAFHSPHDGR